MRTAPNTSPACEICGAAADISSAGRLLCDGCHPAAGHVPKQRDAATSDSLGAGSPRSSFLVPCPENGQEPEDFKRVEWLLAEYAADRRQPKRVVLRLPEDATPEEIKVAEFFRLVHGLRLTTRLPEDVPFSVRWVAGKTGLPKTIVGDAIKQLVKDDVLRHTGSLERRGWPRGTNTYVPGGLRAIEGGAL